MKKHLSTIILILIFVIGLSLLLYPTISDAVNSLHQSKVISDYEEGLSQLNTEDYEKLRADAVRYNKTLPGDADRYHPTAEKTALYNSLLDVGGIMGYIEIPAIRTKLPLYHGTDSAVLQDGVGHIEGSSLPVGGESTHCVLSGHRGLPSAKLLSNLDQLTEGDLFLLHVLDQTLAYQVDQIRIVVPEDVSLLEIENGKDYCTLVTCTPYGVNSHRLLVRGTRVDYNADVLAALRVKADATKIDSFLVLPFVAAPLLIIMLILLLVKYRKRKR